MMKSILARAATVIRREEGAIGWLILGILVGVGLVIWGVIALFF